MTNTHPLHPHQLHYVFVYVYLPWNHCWEFWDNRLSAVSKYLWYSSVPTILSLLICYKNGKGMCGVSVTVVLSGDCRWRRWGVSACWRGGWDSFSSMWSYVMPATALCSKSSNPVLHCSHNDITTTHAQESLYQRWNTQRVSTQPHCMS